MLPPGRGVVVSARPRPFELRTDVRTVPVGLRLDEMVAIHFPDPAAWPAVRVVIRGRLHRRELGEWRLRPRAGLTVEISLVPGNSGGLRIALSLAVVAAAISATVLTGGALTPVLGAAGAGVFGSILGAGVSVLGMMAVNALVPIEPPQLKNNQGKTSPSYSLGGGQNTARFGEPVRKIHGRNRVWPDLAAPWYTSIEGDDLYLHGLLDVGWAPLVCEDWKIGEQSFDDWQDLDFEVLDGGGTAVQRSDLYQGNVVQDDTSGQTLKRSDGWVTRTTRPLTDSVSVDLGFPRGIIAFGHNTGDPEGHDVVFQARWRTAARDGDPAGDWSSPVSWTEHGKTGSPTRRGHGFDMPSTDTWDFSLQRLTDDSAATGTTSGVPKQLDESTWDTIRSINGATPVNLPGVVRLAIRMKATGQHQGVLEKINCIATSIAPAWDRQAQAWASGPTRNPAALFRAALQGPGIVQKTTDSGVDIPGLQDWSEWAEDQGFLCDFVEEREMATLEALKVLAGAGRASPMCPDGTWGVAVDRPKLASTQHYTPRNRKAFRFRRLFVKLPHALRVQFVDAGNGYKPDSYRLVYADGHGDAAMRAADASLLPATEILDWEMPGVTDPDLIHRHARKRLAEMRLRSATAEMDVEWEGWVNTRGDWIRVASDTVEIGLTSGRIAALTVVSGRVTGVDLDEPVLLDGATAMGVRVRLRDGSGWAAALVGFSGERTHLDLSTPVDQAVSGATVVGPLVGDLATVGVLGSETMDFLVTNIRRSKGFGATIEAVPLAPAVHTAEDGPIPPWAPTLTQPAGAVAPVIWSVASDETALHRDTDGTLRVTAVVVFARGGIPLAKYDTVRVSWQAAGTGEPEQHADWPATSAEVRLPNVRLGETYAIRAMYHVRAALANGRDVWGPPSAAWTHTIVGANLPPPDTGDPYLAGDRVAVSYTGAPPDFDGYLWRTATVAGRPWDSATSLSDGPLTEGFILLAEIPDDAVEVLVKAHTRAGQESADPGRLAVIGVPRPKAVEVYAVDLGAQGFPGTIAGASAPVPEPLRIADDGSHLLIAPDGSRLIVDEVVEINLVGGVVVDGVLQGVDTSGWLDPPGGPWLAPPTAPWLGSSYDSFLYVTQFACPANVRQTDRIVLDWDKTGLVGVQFRWVSDMLVRFARTDPLPPRTTLLPPRWVPLDAFLSGNDSANPFRPYQDGIRPQPGQVIEIQFFGRGGTDLRPAITRLRVTIESDLFTWTVTGFQVQPGGSQVLLPSWYRRVGYALATLVMPTGAAKVGPLDESAPGGPTYIAYDRDEQTVPAVIHATVGYA
ncbi:MAG: host specificity factor TipJ family phage tail protein [Blastococcus sp.]